MRAFFISILFTCFIQTVFSQGFIDSILLVYNRIDLQNLPEQERLLLDTNKYYFNEENSDSLLLTKTLDIIFLSNEDSITKKLNLLVKNYSQRKIAEKLSAREEAIYLDVLASSYNNEGYFASTKSNFEESVFLQYKALDIRKDLKDTSGIVSTLLALGVSHYNLLDYKKSNELWKEALEFQLIINDSSDLSETYIFLGGLAIKDKEFDLSFQYLTSALKINRRQSNIPMEAYTLNYFGNSYYAQEKNDSALYYFKKSLDLYESIDDERYLSDLLYSLWKVTREANKWEESKLYALKTFDHAQKYQNPSHLRNGAKALFEVYKYERNYQKSLEMLELYISMDDSINSKDNQRALYDQGYKYKYQQKALLDSLKNKAAIDLQISENSKRKITGRFLWAGLIITLVFALILWNRFSFTKKQKEIIESDKEKLNQANEKLKSLDELKSRLFTNISHELRTPLTVISGMTEKIISQPSKWGSRGAEMIQRNSNQLLHLVNQILELRKLESGTLKLTLIYGDIIGYLRYIVEAFHSFAESKNIHLHFLADESNCEMDYDPEKIMRIVSNLISNAIKFTSEEGNVYIQISKSQGSEFVFKIRDTGKGISKENLPYIFDRFYQIEDSSTRSEEGTGIGLTLVKELVQLMKGKIEVSSEEKQGTQFIIHIPIQNKKMNSPNNPLLPNAPDQIISAQALSKQPLWTPTGFEPLKDLPTILLIEDNEDVLIYLASCLEGLYQIEVTRNGQEGIDKAIELVPDLIISDIMMPFKDGIEVCDTLKTDIRTSHIPIILLTAKADIESKLTGLSKGADAYLTKPFNEEELLIRINNLLNTRLILQERYKTLTPPSSSEDEAVELEDNFIIQVREVIEKHLDNEDFKISILCREIGISRSQLHNKVKALTGLSTSIIIRRIRLEKSTKLLKNPDLTISEIAYLVGYSDPSYFSRNFLEEYGVSPSKMRK